MTDDPRPLRSPLMQVPEPTAACPHCEREWLQALSQVPGVEVYLWGPEALSDVEDILR